MHESTALQDGIDQLVAQVRHVVPGVRGGADDCSDTMSEGSNGGGFDVGAWGEELFSVAEMRDELERLRVENSASSQNGGSSIGYSTEALMCQLPAMVPPLPRGLFVTSKMEAVLAAVLSNSPAVSEAQKSCQIGFCGMGGIGKTTVSTWVVHNEAVRTQFGMIAWISLGQSPFVDACINLLYLQLAGTELADSLSPDQKHEHLKQAFLNRSVLLVLDDCWDAEVAKHFTWIDQTTNSKVLISSRVRGALEGGEIIEVTVPLVADAVKMLLSTAGMELELFQSRKEVVQVVELCKRLPLTIGIAGKLIRQMTTGSSMSDSRDWADVVDLLKSEINDPQGDLSVEERVIRASINSIPAKLRGPVTRLFCGFALAPEDTHLPLPVIGMVYDACTNSDSDINTPNAVNVSATAAAATTAAAAASPTAGVPLSRMRIRKYLKILIDRSLVLGSVDRPQLHDVMLDYVQKELCGNPYKEAQRRLVDALRGSDRMPKSATGGYMKQCAKHHIAEAYDDVWGKSEQAMSWLEDHQNGVQDAVAFATVAVLPNVEMLATEAEDAKLWWSAALRWNAVAFVNTYKAGSPRAGLEAWTRAVEASAKIAPPAVGTGCGSYTQFAADTLSLMAFTRMLMTWLPSVGVTYGSRIRALLLSEAGVANPLLQLKIFHAIDWFASILAGDTSVYAATNLKYCEMILATNDESTDAYAHLSEHERYMTSSMKASILTFGGDEMLFHTPGFKFDCFGPNGDNLVKWFNSYNYEDHHAYLSEQLSADPVVVANASSWILTMQYGRVGDAITILEERLRLLEILEADKMSSSRAFDIALALSNFLLDFHVHGQPQMMQKTIETFGITWDSVSGYLSDLPLSHYTPMEHKGQDFAGVGSRKRLLWQIQSFMVMNLDVPPSKAIEWLESLPGNQEFIAFSMTLPTHDVHAFWGGDHQTCWIALAHEKFELYEGALRFCGLALETDLLKAGAPNIRWALTVAWACKGRVLIKLNRYTEALAAFQTGIESSKDSYPMMQALACRELANCNCEVAPPAFVAAVEQAKRDLDLQLQGFGGRMSKTEFNMLSIAPPA